MSDKLLENPKEFVENFKNKTRQLSLEELDNVVGGGHDIGLLCESNKYVWGECIAKAYSINTDICDFACYLEKEQGGKPSKAAVDALVKLYPEYIYLYDLYGYKMGA